jgi:hypothetical protein
MSWLGTPCGAPGVGISGRPGLRLGIHSIPRARVRDLLVELGLLRRRVGIAPLRALVEVLLGRVDVGVEVMVGHEAQHAQPRRVVPRRSVRALDDSAPGERRRGVRGGCHRRQHGQRGQELADHASPAARSATSRSSNTRILVTFPSRIVHSCGVS